MLRFSYFLFAESREPASEARGIDENLAEVPPRFRPALPIAAE
jgi:hypothetical protein